MLSLDSLVLHFMMSLYIYVTYVIYIAFIKDNFSEFLPIVSPLKLVFQSFHYDPRHFFPIALLPL